MYLFFVRQFNDIDHMTPIIWKMQRDRHPVAVLCLDPEYNLTGDYRLLFLQRQGIHVGHVYDEALDIPGWRHRLLRGFSARCFSVANRLKRVPAAILAPLVNRFRDWLVTLGKKAYNRSRKKYYDASWAQALLARRAAQALCFDHINPGRYVVKALVDAARQLEIPTFALPHGVFIYTNKHVRIGTTEESRLDKFNCFDYVVTQNTLRRDVLVRAGVDYDRIHVLGSARYFDDWMEQNRRILPRTGKLNSVGSSKLKAVFMTTRFAYRVDVDRMRTTFDLLSQLPDLHLVVKPHTRSGKEAEIYERLPLSSVSDISSVELCEWADIVMVIGSSILIEPLKMNKPVLYLKYLHDNITQYEEIGACWTINDEQELITALAELKSNPASLPYTREHVDSFLAEIIFGSKNKENVLLRYEEFIARHSSHTARDTIKPANIEVSKLAIS